MTEYLHEGINHNDGPVNVLSMEHEDAHQECPVCNVRHQLFAPRMVTRWQE